MNEEGFLTAVPDKVDQAMRAAWDPIFNKPLQQSQDQHLHDFLVAYPEHLGVAEQFPLPTIDTVTLRATIQSMKQSSADHCASLQEHPLEYEFQ